MKCVAEIQWNFYARHSRAVDEEKTLVFDEWNERSDGWLRRGKQIDWIEWWKNEMKSMRPAASSKWAIEKKLIYLFLWRAKGGWGCSSFWWVMGAAAPWAPPKRKTSRNKPNHPNSFLLFYKSNLISLNLMKRNGAGAKKESGIVDGMTSKQPIKDNSLDLVCWCGNEINNETAPKGMSWKRMGSGMPPALLAFLNCGLWAAPAANAPQWKEDGKRESWVCFLLFSYFAHSSFIFIPFNALEWN